MKNNILKIIYILSCILISACHIGGSQKYNSLDNYVQSYKNKSTYNNGLLDGIEPGVGYSSDAEHIAPMACFKSSKVIRDSSTSILHSELSMDKQELAKSLNLGFNFKGGYAQFSANAALNYIRDNNSNNLAISYNFINMISRKVNIKYSLNPKKILNKDGIEVYKEGSNPKFRLFCGDRLIDSYTEGAFVITTIQVILSNKIQKRQFEASIGTSISGFSDLSAKVINSKSSGLFDGKVVISAFQLGGDPTQLSKIIPTSMSCSFNDISKCDEFYNTGISNYLKNSFPSQFNKDDSFTPIGNLSFSPISLVDDLNMQISPSYITSEIEEARKKLLNLYSNNLANYQALSDVFYYYPVTLDSLFKKDVHNALKIAEENLFKLQDAKLCWTSPNNCIKTYHEIVGNLTKQNNRYLIANFSPYAYQFDGHLKTLPSWTFHARFYPSSPTTYILLPLPQSFIKITQKHLPVNGFNEAGTYDYYGQGYDWKCGNQYSNYRITPANNGAWSLEWVHCNGEYRSFDGVLQQTVIPSSAELYNFVLHQ